MGSLHALSSTHWDQEPERGRSPAAARRQLGGLRKTRTPWSWRERCARGPGALRVQRFMGSTFAALLACALFAQRVESAAVAAGPLPARLGQIGQTSSGPVTLPTDHRAAP